MEAHKELIILIISIILLLKYLFRNSKPARRERCLKYQKIWIERIQEERSKNESSFAKKVNEIIKERRQQKMDVYICCQTSKEFENGGFWLYFKPNRKPELWIESAGSNGLSSYSYLAYEEIKRSDIKKTDKIIKNALESDPFKCYTSESEK